MSEVRVKTWPLAVVGSVLVHVSALTGVYLAPAGGGDAALSQAGLGRVLDSETTPLYLIPDELPPDVAARLAADQEAAAKLKPQDDPAAEAKPKPETVVLVKPEEELNPVPVQLGSIDGPKKRTEAWLKFDSPHEHGAPEAPVEQPQQDLIAKPAPQGNPGAGGADGQTPVSPAMEQPPQLTGPQAAKPMPSPAAAPGTVSAAKATEPEVAAKAAAADEQRPVVEAKPTSNIPEGPKQGETKAGNSGGEAPKVVQNASEPKVLPVEAAGPTPRPSTDSVPGTAQAAAPLPSAAAAQDNPRAPGAPGIPNATKTVASDRDSDAASVKRTAVFRNGKVEAGEGLDIRTVRPDFSLTTKALATPRSPTLEILFGKDGRAKRVRVLRSSGYEAEVDQPIVTALYNWRAKGRLLDNLPARADSTVALEITIILN